MSDEGKSGGKVTTTDGPVYEMMWDCPRCDTSKLLGKSHRFCPNCGSPQDPDSRYFPPEDEKVAVADHVFHGVDWQCGGCDAPNSNAAQFCGVCGMPRDGGEGHVGTKSEKPEPSPPPAAADEPKKGGGMVGKLLGCGCVLLVLLAVVGLVVSMLWTKSDTVEITGHEWTRTVEVEKYQSVKKTDWCDEMDRESYDVKKTTKKRGSEKVKSGKDCETKKVDQGDGTYKEVEECKDAYSSKDVEDEWCEYKVDDWEKGRTEKASGKSKTPAPSWPKTKAKTCSRAKSGCEREGKKAETYTVKLKDSGGKSHDCEISEKTWTSADKGDKYSVNMRVVTGGPDCDSLKAAK